MSYLDTCVIIAYCVDGDPNHGKAVNIVERLRRVIGANEFYASTLTLTELYSVLSRNIQSFRLPPGIEELVDYKTKLRLAVAYLLQLIPLHIISDEAKLADLDCWKIFNKFFEGINLAFKLKLKTLDLLHIAYASQFMEKGLVKFFVTFDSEILENREAILEGLGIEVLGDN
jgi:predicted nucleic acid-binding protein